MFYYLDGTVTHTEPYIAVIDCGGVGYLCHVSSLTQATLKLGQKSRLYTHVIVREDAFDIYGFADTDERNCFTQLLNTSGVGAKVALSVLSTMTPSKFAMSVISGDEKAITSVPGVGKKLAQRIILELKDKLKGNFSEEQAAAGNAGILSNSSNVIDEAKMALQVLGYTSAEASAALRGCDPSGQSVEDMIRRALKALSR